MLVSRAVFRVLASCAVALATFGSPASAAVAEIPAQQVAVLDSLGIRVAVATYIPPGYSFQDVTATPCARRAKRAPSGACSLGPDYIVRYHKGDSWFAVEGTGGGLGGTSLTYKTFVRTGPFGTVALRFGPGPDGIGLTPSAAQLHSAQNENLHRLARLGSVLSCHRRTHRARRHVEGGVVGGVDVQHLIAPDGLRTFTIRRTPSSRRRRRSTSR